MAEKRKRKSNSPESERIDDIAQAELTKAAEALSLVESKRQNPGEPGYDPDITYIPKLKMGQRGLYFEKLDKEDTSFDHPKTSSDAMTTLQQICWTVDGYGPADEIERRVDSFEAPDLRNAAGLAIAEIHELDISLKLLIEEAAENSDITVTEDDLERLRNDALYTHSPVTFQTSPFALALNKDELLDLLKKLRQEIAWLKDNRDYLSDYMDMAEQFSLQKIEHQLNYDWYPRDSSIELLENDTREHVRRGAKIEKDETGISASKRQRADPSSNEEEIGLGTQPMTF